MDKKRRTNNILQSLDENHHFFYLDMNIAFHEQDFFGYIDMWRRKQAPPLYTENYSSTFKWSKFGPSKATKNCKVKLIRLKSSVPNSAMIHNEWLT